MFRSKFKDLKEKYKKALLQFWLDLQTTNLGKKKTKTIFSEKLFRVLHKNLCVSSIVKDIAVQQERFVN